MTGYCKECGQQICVCDDLPPIRRSEANYWRMRYLENYQELVNANRGIRRLRKKLDNLKNKQRS